MVGRYAGLRKQSPGSRGRTDLRRILLIKVSPAHRSDTITPAGTCPPGRVRAGETVVQGLCRTLAEHYGYTSVQVDRHLGHANRNHESGYDIRAFKFAGIPNELDSICRSVLMGHRWADSHTLARTLTDGMDDILRDYLQDELE